MNQLKAIIKNWRTSMVGVVMFVAIAMWWTDKIETNEFIAVVSCIAGLGFFITKDNTVTGIPKQ